MAYAGLVSLAQTIDQILNHDHSPTTHPHNQEIIRSIRDHVVYLQSFLLPEKANNLDLEGQIREAANAAEDAIEDLMSANNSSDCGSFERRLKQVAEKFESTAGNVAKGVKSNDLMTDSAVVYRSSRLASTGKDYVVAFEEYLMEIFYWLNSSSSGLQVLPIVGMGGIGKTTLAKLVYNDMLVKEHFDIQGWVTVSQDYNEGSIILHLLASMKVIKKAQRDAQRKSKINIPRKDEIQKYLKDKRYLIVMDDMWSKKAWDDVRKLFPENNNGSRIIVTTRLQDVGEYVGLPHIMRPLDEEDSWDLLNYNVFRGSGCPLHIKEVGKRIAALCRGLPLSIVLMAGLLSMIPTNVEVWTKIAESDGKLETVISLNYIHLPPHVKPCFLYMGGFPEDYEIRASELVKLWVAEGFLNRPNGSMSIENVAEDCLKNLAERRLVLVNSWDVDGNIKSCSLHDMVRDFCIRQGRREKSLVPVVDYLPTPILRRHFLPLVLKNYKRISATWYDLDLKDSVHSSRTHSIICIPRKGYGRMGSVKNFSLLRVLHVLCINEYWDWEPAGVFDLIYLTYLASNIPTSIVPPAISKLQNLQTLIIYRSEVRLPVEIWRLRQLRHLIAFSFHQLPHPEEEAIPLEYLQTLLLAVDFICRERMVEMMPDIKKLGICYSGNKSGEGYQLDNLMYLARLEKLKLETLVPFRRNLNSVFPHSLKKLTLSGWGLPWRELAIVGSLPFLQVLKLRNYACDGEHWETTEGEFVSLKLLLIDESNLQHWATESSHFPRLECLMLHRCPYLSGLSTDIGDIPTLQLIEIDDRYQSLLYSAKQIQEERLEIYGYKDLQVRLKRF